MIKESTEYWDIEKFIQNSTNKIIIVDFYANWCQPCKIQTPILEELVTKYPLIVNLVKVNVDESPDLKSKFDIRSIPTLIFFESGNLTPIHTLKGLHSLSVIEALIISFSKK